MLLEDLQDMGVTFISLGEGIDLSTASGKLQLHILAALAEFERARIQERVRAGLARVRAEGRRLGRPALRVPRRGSSGRTVSSSATETRSSRRSSAASSRPSACGSSGPRDRPRTATRTRSALCSRSSPSA